jgi:esterase/lipase superfamily enzyme
VASADRVFILIHGFNNDQKEADAAFQLVEQKIEFKEKDAIIWFHWDGLVSPKKGLARSIGAARIWNNATGFSQMAGMYGLRRILNVIHKPEIYIITHSRGASVFLSALSNPPFKQNFIDDTTWLNIKGAEPLDKGNTNAIHALFLAPAIGSIVFGKTTY